MSATRYLCLHGHFYQPPRENPWHEEIEREVSAAPFHNWNARISAECYRANAASRLVDDQNRPFLLRNNYEKISFNFGPTLLSWLEKHGKWEYNALRKADQHSNNGIAQVYNHIIMPLANDRDKKTQILWGIADFQKHFARMPAGMWLAETAVDDATLDALAEAGIQFTILSPFQAKRWRMKGDPDAAWKTCTDGSIPSGRAYQYTTKNGRTIALFFYDGAIAKGIAFERLLGDSKHLLNACVQAHENRPHPEEPWLVHTATDGESYGHHFQFGDMALSAMLQELDKTGVCTCINYADFLRMFPVIAEAEILENTAWSCSHGVGRWSADCGCQVGRGVNWHQKWRAPLRTALDHVRDILAADYTTRMGLLLQACGNDSNPWDVRDAYIHVILNTEERNAFAERWLGLGADSHAARVLFWQLLEAQRCALLMYTSCGWFFDDIAGLEAIILLKYAARAISLYGQSLAATALEAEIADATQEAQTSMPEASLEALFLQDLAQAPCNDPAYQNGADVYLRDAKPAALTFARVAVNHLLDQRDHTTAASDLLQHYRVHILQSTHLQRSPLPLDIVRLRIEDKRTEYRESLVAAFLSYGGIDFRCIIFPYSQNGMHMLDVENITSQLRKAADTHSVEHIIHTLQTLQDTYHGTSWGVGDLFADMAVQIAQHQLENQRNLVLQVEQHFYRSQRPLLASLLYIQGIHKAAGVPTQHLPELGLDERTQALLSNVLGERARLYCRELAAFTHASSAHQKQHQHTFYTNTAKLRNVCEEAAEMQVQIPSHLVGDAWGQAWIGALTRLLRDESEEHPHVEEHQEHVQILLDLGQKLGICTRRWEAQTLFFAWLKRPHTPQTRPPSHLVDALNRFLSCRF